MEKLYFLPLPAVGLPLVTVQTEVEEGEGRVRSRWVLKWGWMVMGMEVLEQVLMENLKNSKENDNSCLVTAIFWFNVHDPTGCWIRL